ncbi:hypothetical protein BU26DRAFT_527541 [Trematosphaeria pertusa]|uniref:Uncharacterized protein n=1 Tax=Trematosphaeria pertusa TaxID=390896 RepID=A0A6A6IVX1_9PLEO|nr:uncharacterized protein BU26DRAFT_527541 [Trematosphaeria pertusa]KAF2254418.1 hypothetical protein BU26DRAFT_527541 [Trematosphaeria pertusa]
MSFVPPQLPDDFESMDEDERAREQEQFRRLLKRRIFNDASSPWEGFNNPLQMDIARQEAQRRAALDESLREVDSEMERINGVLGIASDGWTPNESFESAKERARLIREEGLAVVGDDRLKEMTEQHWPFDDCNEDE